MHTRYIVRSIAHYRMNVVVKILIISDFIGFLAIELCTPIFALFVVDAIPNTDITVVGISASLFLLSKSIFEVPIGMFIDKTRSEKDDLFFACLGVLLIGIGYLCYIFIHSISQLYILQIFLGFASAISYPGWCTIFTHHLDKGKEGFEWSMYDVLTGLGMAAAAALGGLIASVFGFSFLFIIIFILSVLSALLLLTISKQIFLYK